MSDIFSSPTSLEQKMNPLHAVFTSSTSTQWLMDHKQKTESPEKFSNGDSTKGRIPLDASPPVLLDGDHMQWTKQFDQMSTFLREVCACCTDWTRDEGFWDLSAADAKRLRPEESRFVENVHIYEGFDPEEQILYEVNVIHELCGDCENKHGWSIFEGRGKKKITCPKPTQDPFRLWDLIHCKPSDKQKMLKPNPIESLENFKFDKSAYKTKPNGLQDDLLFLVKVKDLKDIFL